MTKEWEARLGLWIKALDRRLYTPVESMTFTFAPAAEHLTLRQAAALPAREIREGERWGREWEYGWFFTRLNLGSWADGKRVVLDLDFGGEATLFVNGEVFGTRRADWVKAQRHLLVDNWLRKTREGDEIVEFAAEAYAGHDLPPELGHAAAGPVRESRHWEHNASEGRTALGRCTFGVWDEEAYHLLLEVNVLDDIRRTADPASLRHDDAERALEQFTMTLDPSLEGEAFARSVAGCRALLRPYLACVNGSTAPHLFAVGHAHIDLSWLWPVEETQRKVARTLAAQIRLMDEYPEYKMLQSQPQLWEMAREHYPGLFERMREKVRAGQLIPEGAMWVESDTNLPCGESLIRQIVYGKRYFRDEFGVEDDILWLPDVFGYTAALPQILKGCGVKYFATAKIFWAYNGGDPFPYHYFDWKGLDGSRVRAILHDNYSSDTTAGALIQKWNNRRRQPGLRSLLAAVGYGDGGGGCCRDHIENVRLLNDCEGVPKITFEHPAALMEQMEKECRDVPEYVGELYFQAHRGTYTTQARVKQLNRRCELALREAEMWSALASARPGAEYPAQALEKHWKVLLKNQMHDILPGSAIGRVYARAVSELEEVLAFASDTASAARAALTQPDGGALTVFNSLSWERDALVRLPDGWDGAAAAGGEALPAQRTADGCFVRVRVPSCGLRTLYPAAPQSGEAVSASPNALENRVVRVALNEAGEITSVFDKRTGTEWAAGPLNALHLYRDVPGNYEAWDIDSMRPEVPLERRAKITVEAAGPLFAELRVERTVGSSVWTQWVRLEQDSRELVFRTRVDWRETQKMLKAAFPVNVVTDNLKSEIQYGFVERPNHRSRPYDADRFEVCNHRWSALCEQTRGCAVLNDCKYGVSAEDNSIELTLLRAPEFPDETADRGVHEFTYSFLFWDAPLAESGVVRRAFERNAPVCTAPGAAGEQAFVTVSDPGVVIDWVKRADSGEDAVVVRAYESTGGSRRARIALAAPVAACTAADMAETRGEALAVQDGAVDVSFRPFEVRTFVFACGAPEKGERV